MGLWSFRLIPPLILRLMGPEKMYRESFLGHNFRRSMEPSSRGKRRFAAEKLNVPLSRLQISLEPKSFIHCLTIKELDC